MRLGHLEAVSMRDSGGGVTESKETIPNAPQRAHCTQAHTHTDIHTFSMEAYGFIWPLSAHLFNIHLTLSSSGCQDNSKQYAFTSVFGFIKFAQYSMHFQYTFFSAMVMGDENQTDASSLP